MPNQRRTYAGLLNRKSRVSSRFVPMTSGTAFQRAPTTSIGRLACSTTPSREDVRHVEETAEVSRRRDGEQVPIALSAQVSRDIVRRHARETRLRGRAVPRHAVADEERRSELVRAVPVAGARVVDPVLRLVGRRRPDAAALDDRAMEEPRASGDASSVRTFVPPADSRRS
jgi:hypothetical protein